MSPLVAVLGVLLSALADSIPASSAPPLPLPRPEPCLWSFRTEKEFDWWKQTPPGWLLVGSKDLLMGVEPDSGKVAWQRSDLKGMNRQTLRFFPPTPLALVNLSKPTRRSLLFNVTTGQDLWATDSLGMELAEDVQLIPGRAALLLAGPCSSSKAWITLAVNLTSGRVLWSCPSLDAGWKPARDDDMSCQVMNLPPTYIFDSDSTLIAFRDTQTVRRVNFLTDRLVWDVATQVESNKKRGLIKMITSSGSEERKELDIPFERAVGILSADRTRLYIPHHNTITAFRTSDGARLWAHDPHFEGVVEDLVETPDALIVRVLLDDPCGHWRFSCIERESGAVRFDYPSQTVKISKLFSSVLGWERCSNLLVVDEHLVVADDKRIRRIRLADGIEEEPLDPGFECCDHPVLIEPLADGFLVAGEQQAIWFDDDWRMVKRIYHPEPTNSSLGLGLLALSVTSSLIGDIKMGPHATLTVDGYDVALQELMSEFHSSSDAYRYLFMLSDPEEGSGDVPADLHGQYVFVVDKSTRETIATLPAEKKPDYKVDPWNRRAYFKISDQRIDCYGF